MLRPRIVQRIPLRRSTKTILLAGVIGLSAACQERDPGYEPVPEPPGIVERLLTPDPVPIPPAAITEAGDVIRSQVDDGAFPGAALAVGSRDTTQQIVTFGKTAWADEAPAVDPDSTLYDLGSLTKVVATTAAVMALVEDGRLALDEPVRRYVPEFSGGDKDQVTVRQLLTHTSGVRAGVVEVEGENPREVRRNLVAMSLALEPGADVLYSDLGFIILWEVAERAAGEPLPRYLRRRVWGPLGMNSTDVGVPTGCERCAPTLFLEERNEPYTGGSYDELGRSLDGVAGNAGAFSTARDLARFAAMIANEGRVGDVRVFDRGTVRAFTRAQPDAGTRALGWEVYCREGIIPDQQKCEEVYAFGHTGVTGTSIWIDPENRRWLVLLTNRTYLPKTEIEMQKFRRRVYETVTGNGPAP